MTQLIYRDIVLMSGIQRKACGGSEMMARMMVALGILSLGLLVLIVGPNGTFSPIQAGIGGFLAVVGAAGFLLGMKG